MSMSMSIHAVLNPAPAAPRHYQQDPGPVRPNPVPRAPTAGIPRRPGGEPQQQPLLPPPPVSRNPSSRGLVFDRYHHLQLDNYGPAPPPDYPPLPPSTSEPAAGQSGAPKSPVLFRPYIDELDEATKAEVRSFVVTDLDKIHTSHKTIPYKTDKRDFQTKTGRRGFEVFEYEIKVPGTAKDAWTVLWDYQVGLVRVTPFFKVCGFLKTAPGKVLDKSKGLRDMSYSITGGSIFAQGYWMPWGCARDCFRRFCYHIAPALVPMFGPSFPGECALPGSLLWRTLEVDADVVQLWQGLMAKLYEVTDEAEAPAGHDLERSRSEHAFRRQLAQILGNNSTAMADGGDGLLLSEAGPPCSTHTRSAGHEIGSNAIDGSILASHRPNLPPLRLPQPPTQHPPPRPDPFYSPASGSPASSGLISAGVHMAPRSQLLREPYSPYGRSPYDNSPSPKRSSQRSSFPPGAISRRAPGLARHPSSGTGPAHVPVSPYSYSPPPGFSPPQDYYHFQGDQPRSVAPGPAWSPSAGPLVHAQAGCKRRAPWGHGCCPAEELNRAYDTCSSHNSSPSPGTLPADSPEDEHQDETRHPCRLGRGPGHSYTLSSDLPASRGSQPWFGNTGAHRDDRRRTPDSPATHPRRHSSHRRDRIASARSSLGGGPFPFGGSDGVHGPGPATNSPNSTTASNLGSPSSTATGNGRGDPLSPPDEQNVAMVLLSLGKIPTPEPNGAAAPLQPMPDLDNNHGGRDSIPTAADTIVREYDGPRDNAADKHQPERPQDEVVDEHASVEAEAEPKDLPNKKKKKKENDAKDEADKTKPVRRSHRNKRQRTDSL